MLCSVGCVKQHKIDFECSGVRCKTAFVPLQAFTDQHLLSGKSTLARYVMYHKVEEHWQERGNSTGIGRSYM